MYSVDKKLKQNKSRSTPVKVSRGSTRSNDREELFKAHQNYKLDEEKIKDYNPVNSVNLTFALFYAKKIY